MVKLHFILYGFWDYTFGDCSSFSAKCVSEINPKNLNTLTTHNYEAKLRVELTRSICKIVW